MEITRYFIFIDLMMMMMMMMMMIVCQRTPPKLRLYPLDPHATVGEMLHIRCEINSLVNISIQQVSFNVTNNAGLQDLLELYTNRTITTTDRPMIGLELEATMDWNDIIINCCIGKVCHDQTKILICNAPPKPNIVEYKIYNWRDLIISWDIINTKDIHVEASYKINKHANDSGNFTKCRQYNDTTCVEFQFFQNLKETDVTIEIEVISKNKCGRWVATREEAKMLEDIVQMEPVDNLKCNTAHNDGSAPKNGHVIISFSFDHASGGATANLRCSCKDGNYSLEKNMSVTNKYGEFKLSDLPIYVDCTCWVKVRCLGWWSEETSIQFKSPQDVPVRNPKIIAYHLKRCDVDNNVITLFIEKLTNEISNGDLKYLQISIEPNNQCLLLKQNVFRRCQGNDYYTPNDCRNITTSFHTNVILSTLSSSINISLKGQNEAGACPDWSQYVINTESSNFIGNFSVIRMENGTFTLTWNMINDLNSLSSLIVLWCQTDDQNCNDIKWRIIPTSFTHYSVHPSLIAGGKSVVFGVGGQLVSDNSIPRIQLSSNICLSKVLPLPPVIDLKEIKDSEAHINFYQPICNFSGYSYKQVVRLSRVNDVKNNTESINEIELHTLGSKQVHFLLPDTGYNYLVEAFSHSQGGLVRSNPIHVRLPRSASNTGTIVGVVMILLAIIGLGILAIGYRRRLRSKGLKIEVPRILNYQLDRLPEDSSTSHGYATAIMTSPFTCPDYFSTGITSYGGDNIQKIEAQNENITTAEMDENSCSDKEVVYQFSGKIVQNSQEDKSDKKSLVDDDGFSTDDQSVEDQSYQKCGKCYPSVVLSPLATLPSPIIKFYKTEWPPENDKTESMEYSKAIVVDSTETDTF